MLPELVQQYADNGQLVVAFANSRHVDYAANWLAHVRAANISNYLIGAMDLQTANALSKAGAQYFSMFEGMATDSTSELLDGRLPYV